MFNNKEITELKEEMTTQLSNLSSTFNQMMQSNENAMSNLKNAIAELKDKNESVTVEIRKDLADINNIKSEFQQALNRINSVSRNIEETASMNVKEVADKEIESIKASSKQFRGLESELNELVEKVNEIQLELSKFISISQQIKLVDFSLQKHQEEMSKTEKERLDLRNENERLKSIMAKMKRGR